MFQKISINNLKKNWFLLISAFAFLCLEAPHTLAGVIGVAIGCLLLTAIAASASDIWGKVSKCGIGVKLFSLFTAIGICWYGKSQFPLSQIIGIAGAVIALIFVYAVVALIWDAIITTFRKTKLFSDLGVFECIVYGVIVALLIGLAVYSFSHSEAFYATAHSYDVIYTSDSPSLVKDNAYLDLFHSENDFRQPLFMVFASPFLGISYLLAQVFPSIWWMSAFALNGLQILMMLFSHFLIAKMMNLTSIKRVCFVTVFSVSYTTLLFSLMMEQYIVAYFWLVFFVYQYVMQKRASRLALMGVTGTLLTGAILAPLTSEKYIWKHPIQWMKEMLVCAGCFLLLLFGAGRFDVIYDLSYRVVLLSGYTGKDVTFWDKVQQYFTFISDCFLSPRAYIDFEIKEYATWKLNPVSEINLIGVIIFALIVISFIVNRKNKLSQIAGAWILYSIVILCVFGWGTAENGLILYALYFGWAIWVLLFQLMEAIEKKWKLKFLIPIISVILTVILVQVNFNGIRDLVSFAIKYYPL